MPEFFHELLALVHPDRLLHDPRATGRGVRVSVVDSGIDRDILAEQVASRGHVMGPIAGVVIASGIAEPRPDEGRASTPHGTTVADVILTIAPQVELFSIDVFGATGGDAESVVKAIYHALDVWQCHIINLSLGIIEARLQPLARRMQLQRAIEEAYHRGVLVVAAAPNDHPYSRSYPAAFAPPLLSVDKAIFADPLEVRYRPSDSVEFQAHARGYLGPFAREPATSWAAPHVTGVAARLLSLAPQLRPFEVKALLSLMSRARS
jgi:subtilisin family serine protease